MLGFSTAAWRLAPRDKFIGWTPQLREKNLPLVVDNPRFLILPWIKIPNLGSHILAIVRRRLPDDWAERYNKTPVLIETFVETPRHTGAVYNASGWIRVGTTQGRDDTTATRNAPSRKGTSGFAPSEKTGSEPSTGESTSTGGLEMTASVILGACLPPEAAGLHGTTESLPMNGVRRALEFDSKCSPIVCQFRHFCE